MLFRQLELSRHYERMIKWKLLSYVELNYHLKLKG